MWENCARNNIQRLLTPKGECVCVADRHEINKTAKDLMPLLKGSRRHERSHETRTPTCTGAGPYRRRRLHAIEAIVVVLWKLIECIWISALFAACSYLPTYAEHARAINSRRSDQISTGRSKGRTMLLLREISIQKQKCVYVCSIIDINIKLIYENFLPLSLSLFSFYSFRIYNAERDIKYTFVCQVE